MNGPSAKRSMQKAGLARWDTLEPIVEALLKEGKIDAAPGRQGGSLKYFVPSAPGSAERSTS